MVSFPSLLFIVAVVLPVVAIAAEPAVSEESALPHDLLMPQLQKADDSELDDRPILNDISKHTCWIGGYTEEGCCRNYNSTCWDDFMTMEECCPNADCWEGNFNYATCCNPEKDTGDKLCWSGIYSHARCCALTEPAPSWVDNLFSGQSTDAFYSFDEFYNDAQYGSGFGYYSLGHVLGLGKLAKDANEFAHFTTFPMALSPHFGRVVMRLLFLMWKERALTNQRAGLPLEDSFQVVEMGAGSGQLGQDIRDCVVENCLGLSDATHRRWSSAFRYTILERSPALAERQRERGLEVIISDAQMLDSCEVLKSKAKRENFLADAIISNELIDAFAPVKLKLSVFDLVNVDPASCASWTEMKLLHLIKIQDVMTLFAQALGIPNPAQLVEQLKDFTTEFFCGAAKTSIGRAAMALLPDNTTCLGMVLGLSEIMEMTKFQIPSASNNVMFRLRKDSLVQQNLRKIVAAVQKDLKGFLAIPRHIYQQLRKALKDSEAKNKQNLDITFLIASKTKRLSVPISPERCKEQHIGSFLKRHEERNRRLARFYHDLGYPSIYVLMRPGEEEFLRLTDCLLNQEKTGHVLTVDYGASYEPLSHSLSVDPHYDGIFVPPIPPHLMEELPHCHGDWTVCAGRIDWTTFVDFTNMAAVGNELGYETVFYGPQCLMEQMTSSGVFSGVSADSYDLVSGYSVLENTDWIGRHTINWHGPEKGEPWEQRWSGFKALLQRVPPLRHRKSVNDYHTALRAADPKALSKNERNTLLTKPVEPVDHSRYTIIRAPSWHLDTEQSDPCWLFDPTNMPIADWVKRNMEGARTSVREVLSLLSTDVNRELGIRFAYGYEEAQLSVRLVDFIVKSVGCLPLSNPSSISLKWNSWYRERFASIWRLEVLDKVGPAVMNILRAEAVGKANKELPSSRHYPYECMARQTLRILCGSGS